MVKIITTVLCFMLLSDGVYAASSSRECAQSEQQQLENLCCLTLKKIRSIFPASSKISTSQEGLFELGDEKNMSIRNISGNELKSKYNGNYIEVEYDGKTFSLPINSTSICVSDEKAYILQLMEADPKIVRSEISSICNTIYDLKTVKDYYSELKKDSSNGKFFKIDRLLEEIFQELEEKLKDQREMECELLPTSQEKIVAIKELIENLRNKYSDDNSTPKEIVFIELASTNSKKDFKNMTREEALKELKMCLELRRMLKMNMNSYDEIENFKYSIGYMKVMEEYKQKGFPEYEKGARYHNSDFNNTSRSFSPYLHIIELLKFRDKSLYDEIVKKIGRNFCSENPLMEHIEIFLEELTKSKFELWSDKMHSITPEFYDFFFSKIIYAYHDSKKIFSKYLEDDDFLSLIKGYIDELQFLFHISIKQVISMLTRDYDFIEKNLNKLFDSFDEVYYCIQDVFEDKEMTREEKISQIKELDEVR